LTFGGTGRIGEIPKRLRGWGTVPGIEEFSLALERSLNSGAHAEDPEVKTPVIHSSQNKAAGKSLGGGVQGGNGTGNVVSTNNRIGRRAIVSDEDGRNGLSRG